MPLWLIFLLMGLIKVPIAALMLWIPLRSDDAMSAYEGDGAPGADDDSGGGGSVRNAGPRDPHPRLPRSDKRRRGDHDSPAPIAPSRVRHAHVHVSPALHR